MGIKINWAKTKSSQSEELTPEEEEEFIKSGKTVLDALVRLDDETDDSQVNRVESSASEPAKKDPLER